MNMIRLPKRISIHANSLARNNRFLATAQATSALPPGTAEPRVRKKRVTKVKYSDLPLTLPNAAGIKPLDPDWRSSPGASSSIEESAALSRGLKQYPQTQLAREIHENLTKFPHCILLTRVGQFYESYFDQAIDVARLLNIKETTKSWGGRRVPMCGFPLSHLDRHLKSLVQVDGKFVALCEEFKSSDGTFERRVTRIVTPGTLIDESFVNHYENNFLLAITPSLAPGAAPRDSQTIGLAWIDVSTGEFFTQSCTPEELKDELVRIGPKEVVLPSFLKDDRQHPIRQALEEEPAVISYVTNAEEADQLHETDERPPAEDVLPADSSKAVFASDETRAIQLINQFLRAHLLEHMPPLTSPLHQQAEGRMQIDSHTIKALEIREGMREGGTTGSLLSVIKRTVTTSGTRLLARWLCSPSTSLAEIRTRHALVSLFVIRPHLRRDLILLLKKIEDTSRIVQTFLLGRGNTEDLLAIRDTIQLWAELKKVIDLEMTFEQPKDDADNADMWSSLGSLVGRIRDLRNLAERIDMAVDESGLRRRQTAIAEESEEENVDDPLNLEQISARRMSTLKEPIWTIKPQFSPQLATLHRKRKRLLQERDAMELDLQRTYNAPSVTLRLNGSCGWHIHFAKIKDTRGIEESSGLAELSRSRSTRTYFYRPWSILGTQIAETEALILEGERDAFATLRSEVNVEGNALRHNARIGDELDVTLAFAELADEMRFVRPILNDGTSYHVENGRHPMVELGLLDKGRTFVPNDLKLDVGSKLQVITGPNMAGKSTVLRQTALISILAQTGSFVPADHAELGIVDKVFSRIGAKDDLFRDRSTFMVEMLETAEILKRATERSLVIMDEVGRGTTVREGLAIAFATVHHLYTVNRCRALFATHFHDLVDMLGYNGDGKVDPENPFNGIGFFCNDVDDAEGGYFAYSHRLRPGVNRTSHSLKVAGMGGMPQDVIDTASSALSWLEQRQVGLMGDHDGLQALGRELAAKKVGRRYCRKVCTLQAGADSI